jgi:hypothetical protein
LLLKLDFVIFLACSMMISFSVFENVLEPPAPTDPDGPAIVRSFLRFRLRPLASR